jgi:Carboxypeptidase regulatory-like domain
MHRLLRSTLTASLLAATMSGAPAPAVAQSQATSAIRGTVTGPDGAGLADVEVSVKHTLTGAEHTVVTDARGRFLVLLLQPGGPYQVTVSRLGYTQEREKEIQLLVGQTYTLSFQLQARPVEVEGVAVAVERKPVFNPTQVGPVTFVNEGLVQSLPILSRDVMELSTLSPLVRTTEGGGFSVGGQNDRYNALLVDGLLNQDAFGLTPGGVPGAQAGAKILPLDAVSQYEVLVAPYDARLSGFAGGVMNAITKTGTNDFTLRALAVGRPEALMGDLTLPTGPAQASGVKRELLGVSAGGPIIRDKAHFFVSTEVERRTQPPTGYNLERDDPSLVGLDPVTVHVFQDLFESTFGIETGKSGSYPLAQDLANVFGRVDWNFSGGRRLTVRDVFSYASKDESPNRSPFEPYELSSNAVFRRSTSNALSAQLFSDFGNRGGNEVDFTVQRTTDGTTPASDAPQVEVSLAGAAGALASVRSVRVGGQFYAQDNDLAQTSARLSNTLTLVRGRSTYALGASAALYDITHSYLPGANGDWSFANWPDLLLNAPQTYQRAVLLDGQSATVRFQVAELGAFAQDQLEFKNGLTLRLGLRMDTPFTLDRPEENPFILDWAHQSTANVPSGTALLSPRLGFNWQSGGTHRTQIRGGAGLFTGQIPYVWLSNAFENTGLRYVTQICTGRRYEDPPSGNTVPPFDPSTPPTTCLHGAPTDVRVATLFQDGFKYPQYAKLSAALDREITSKVSATVGYMFSRSVNQVLAQDLNISEYTGNQSSTRGYGSTRPLFGYAVDQGYTPLRDLPGYDQVLLITNGGGDRAWSLSAEVRGSLWEDRLGFQAGYAYARSYDRMSLTSVDMISNFGFTPTHGNPNDPPLTPSNFDRPHKVVLALYGTPIPGLDHTEVSLLYTGESGLPYSYVYRGDLNGDGYPGPGPASDRNNDLVYVPLEASDVPSSLGTLTRLAVALETDPCLKQFKGYIMIRNHCRAPWQNRLDLRVAQTTHVRGWEVRFDADMINVLNLMNHDWGLVRSIAPVASLLEPWGRNQLFDNELLSEWAGGLLPVRTDSGQLQSPQPWSVASPDSQWQAQLGVRLTVGGARGGPGS